MAPAHPLIITDLLSLPDQTYIWSVLESWGELSTLTPVQGWLKVTHLKSYIQVKTEVKTIITLTCDRCLQNYNHRLFCDAEELLWLATATEPDAPQDGLAGDLVEAVDAQGTLDLADWLYQQLCLALPHPQRCEATCPGIQLKPEPITPPTESWDDRWAALAQLRQALEPNNVEKN
ncbi:DUF177 domain-containing protein [Candidatus Synechococcus calcipolaris G9]|uniref:DUF177 domain-containing protein n=1 Tax=Candidatus Synechococcus calcipolaris G9 TaxID=1497997 RepID=A0ABT6EZZ5_9SYNE|nr:DUF177 domain-containing protein [Candidatus Synechococcus calcipolaris]MDG2991176.1 DUF177 domain-containing protein [Candidatus Synechococcus calcipolaris G9]